MKKNSIVIAMVLVLALTVSTFAASFADVPSNHWAYEAVNELVAAGLIQGYPDGTFKGQNDLTRYEIAVMVARLLNDMEEARAELVDQVDFMVNDALISANSGLSEAEAEDVQAIVAAVVAKNTPAEAPAAEVVVPQTLSEGQTGEVMVLIGNLAAEFAPELETLGVQVADLEGRVTALEDETSSVTFSGSYAVDFTDQDVEGGVIDDDIDYYWINDTAAYDGEAAIAPTDPTVEIEYKDDYVYSDPWDDDSDEIAADESNGEIEQTLNLQADIVKDGYTATVKIDVDEDEDEFDLDSAELALENSTFAAVYNNANTANISDYAFDGSEFNGVTVNFKNYGVDVFAGIKGYDLDDKKSTEDHDVTLDGNNGNFAIEKSVTKYELDDDTGMLVPVYDDETDFYVFGAKKAFDLAGLNLNAKYAGRNALDGDALDNWLGFDTATDLSGLDVTFDFGYYVPEGADNGSLVRFGASKDLDFAGVEFNYKNRGENFEPISHEDNVVFDDGHDDYDEFTTGLAVADTTGWNFTVTPKVFEDIDLTTEVFYASIDEASDEKTKLSLTGEMPILMDGLTANGEYTIVDPVEAADGTEENTTKVGVDYEKGYVTANASLKNVTDVDFVANDEKSVTAFGAAIADYPLVDALTASAGFSYEKEAKDYDLETTEYNFGLGYVLGAADLSYDFTNKKVDGADDVNGTYNTNKFGLTYPIVEGTDFVASYEILDLDVDAALNGASDYTVKTATAGVSVSF